MLLATPSELVVRGFAQHIRLESQSLEAATELVTRRRSEPTPHDDMKALYRRCGGDPLFELLG